MKGNKKKGMKSEATKFFVVLSAVLAILAGFVTGVLAQSASSGSKGCDYVIQKSRIKINAINPTGENNLFGTYYPGFRGNNQLVIYTSAYGDYTDTNEFGKEAVVIEDKVFGFCGSNCYIPKNGYIVSGHGSAKKWINEKLMEGATLKINRSQMILESTITPESYLYKAGQRINDAKKIIMEYKNTLPGYQHKISQNYLSQAIQKYNESKYLIDECKYEEGKDTANNALKMADTSFYYAIPAVQNEFHGVWLRPVEKNQGEVAKTLDKLRKSGIDNVFLETYYHGYTIFPSMTMASYGIREQRPEFSGWNPLQVWINEAHKRNIKIHVWFQTFYLGNNSIATDPKSILSVYPEWANYQKKNAYAGKPMPSISEHNGYFLDPANPSVQRFLTHLLQEITGAYNVDGINIDYIRYPKSLAPNISNYLDSTWGYTAYARSEFKSLYNKDPVDIGEDHSLLKKWVAYRQQKITDFVSNLRNIVGDKNIMISAVIFPNFKDTAETKLQNWPLWGKNAYIDAFTPLIMSSDTHMAASSVREIRSLGGESFCILAGLFEPFTAGSPAELLAQIASVRKEGSSGIVIFDNAHLNDDFTEALSARAFRK